MKKMMFYCLLAIISVLLVTSCDKNKDSFNQEPEKPPITTKKDSVIFNFIFDVPAGVTFGEIINIIGWPPDKLFSDVIEKDQRTLSYRFVGDTATSMIGKEGVFTSQFTGALYGASIYLFMEGEKPIKQVIQKGTQDIKVKVKYR